MDGDDKRIWPAVIGAIATVVAAIIVSWPYTCQFIWPAKCPPDPIATPTAAAGVTTPPTATPTVIPTPTPTAIPVEVSVYSSDTKEDWLDAVAEAFNDAGYTTSAGHPIRINLYHVKSGSSMQDILDGKIQPIVWSPGEQSWVDQINRRWTDRYRRPLIPAACRDTVRVPIGFAMVRPMAEAMDWPEPIGWEDILALASAPEGWAGYGHPEWGRPKFGHTHPDHSNSGLLILTALAYATLDGVDTLAPEIIRADEFMATMGELELNTFHYGQSSRDNMERMRDFGPGYLHITNGTEAEMLRVNKSMAQDSRFPLVFVVPEEGTVWSNHPYCVLDAEWASDEQREAARIFGDYLLEPEQQRLAPQYFLRPADSSVPLGEPFTEEFGTLETILVPSLPGPSEEVANAIKDAFHRSMKKMTVVLALDTSDSMNGRKIDDAVEAAAAFIGELERDDDVYVYNFNTDVALLDPGGRVGDVGEELKSTVLGLYAEGTTALYDAICNAAEHVEALRAEDEAKGRLRLYGIIVLSDGANAGGTLTENEMFDCISTREDVRNVPVFTIAYGEDADDDLLTRVANRTRGQMYQSGPDTIKDVLLRILTE